MVKENIIQDKSYAFALTIIDLVRKFPSQKEGYVIGNQLLKSGTSIGANVEEAIGAFSKNDFWRRKECLNTRKNNYRINSNK